MPEQNLGLGYIEQEQDNWCWAACMEMVVGPSHRQCVMANNAFEIEDGKCCVSGHSPECDRPLKVKKITSEWGRYGQTADFSQAPLTEEQTVQALDGGNPIEIGLLWNGGGGHAVLLVGYSKEDEDLLFTVYDPLEGVFVGPHDEVVSAFGSGKWTWSWVIETASGGV